MHSCITVLLRFRIRRSFPICYFVDCHLIIQCQICSVAIIRSPRLTCMRSRSLVSAQISPDPPPDHGASADGYCKYQYERFQSMEPSSTSSRRLCEKTNGSCPQPFPSYLARFLFLCCRLRLIIGTIICCCKACGRSMISLRLTCICGPRYILKHVRTRIRYS